MKKRITHSYEYGTGKEISRRRFIGYLGAAGVMVQTGLWYSCTGQEDIHPLTEEQMYILIAVQNILFPPDKNGPGAADFHAERHFLWVVNDTRLDPDENAYLIRGIAKFATFVKHDTGRDFRDLSPSGQVKSVEKFSKTGYGENWLSRILTLIFEAMLSDPVYGYNTVESGWKWLDHIPGLPRPDKLHRYDEIFHTLMKNRK